MLTIVSMVFLILLGSEAIAGPERSSSRMADPHSFADIQKVRVSSLRLDLSLDFDRRVMQGSVELLLKRIAPTDRLVLDTRDIVVERVFSMSENGEMTRVGFRMGPPDSVLGSPLSIDLPKEAVGVRIEYQTVPTASALGWMPAGKTAGKKGPFLFTQSQAIHARSWIPCQDTPGVRVPYKATIRVPKGLTAVMSAQSVGGDPESGRYEFDMPQPIPS